MTILLDNFKVKPWSLTDMSPEAAHYCEQVLAGRVADGATLYALKVFNREIVAGPLVRLACRRHLKDLDNPGLIWDPEAAQRAINFFPDMLVFTDGAKVGKPFELQLWQQFIVGSLFGWKGSDGWRRFRTAYVEIGKGNGKSPLAGGIGIYLLIADGEGAAEVYAAATKLDQAKILWNDAKRMVEASSLLSGTLEVRANSIVHVPTSSVFKPISSEKRGLDGPRVHGGLIDELHEHADATVVNKLRAGTKARNQALILEITNSGHDKKSICYQHHDFTARILKEIQTNETWFGFICGLDQGDDWEKDEKCWIKANPNLGVSIQLKYLREQVEEAAGMPAKRSIVARLNFCEWVGAENPWISEQKWNSCLVDWSQVDEASLKYVPAYVGLDLSSRKDLTALAIVWAFPDGYLGRVFYFTPAEGLAERAKEDRAPYDEWVRDGWIEAVPGPTVDYGFVARKLGKLMEEFNVQAAAFDPWRIEMFNQELAEQNIVLEMVKHAQGWTGAQSEESLWMPKSLELWEDAILKGQYKVENNPVSTACSANAVVVSDAVGNRKFEKRHSSGKMDGCVAQAMAVGLASAKFGPKASIYEETGLKVL